MRRLGLVCVLAVSASAAAQPRPPGGPGRVLDAPVLTTRPQGALASFAGEGVSVVVGWRPVPDAAKYRVTLTNAENAATDLETTEPRVEKKGVAPGRYQLTVTAIDQRGGEGAVSEALPITVIEIRAVPPGFTAPALPTRGAYAVGTRFSSPGMHCELGNAPIDDLRVGPENELRITTAGVVTLRCAGIPGYLEQQVVLAPVHVAVHVPSLARGRATPVHVTLASVAALGPKLDVEAIGDIRVGPAARTAFGVDVPVTALANAKQAALAVRAGEFELGRVPLALVDAPADRQPRAAAAPADWRAADLGGHIGLFVPPSSGGAATAIGNPTDPADTITSGPLVGIRVGFFPTRRVGIEGETALIAAGYADDAGVAQLLATRAQLAVRAAESRRFGVRLIAGTGLWATLRERRTSERGAAGEIHAGVALSVETSPNLWLRFQLADLVTTARNDGYAHCLEIQLGIVTRVGRRDSF